MSGQASGSYRAGPGPRDGWESGDRNDGGHVAQHLHECLWSLVR